MMFYIILQVIVTLAIVGFALLQLKRMADAQEDSARHLAKIAREISEKKSHQPE
jgi:hypothetical protein